MLRALFGALVWLLFLLGAEQQVQNFFVVNNGLLCSINLTVGCHYFPPGLQLPPQPLRGLRPILLLGEQRHNGCEQFA